MGNRAIENLRDEVRRPALDLVWLELRALQKRRARGLGDDDLHLGARETNHFARAGQRAAGAPARYADTSSRRPAKSLRISGPVVWR